MLHTWGGVCPAPCRHRNPPLHPRQVWLCLPTALTKAGKAPKASSTEHSGSASWLRILRDETLREARGFLSFQLHL